jgi:hypothetical protein
LERPEIWSSSTTTAASVVNRVPLVEPYVAIPADPAGTFVVPQHHVLLLGDNRNHSSDSRGWEQPFLPTAAIRGRVILGVRPHGSVTIPVRDALAQSADPGHT